MMLRVEWNSSMRSKYMMSLASNGINGVVSAGQYPLAEITEFAKFVDAKTSDKFPLRVSLSPMDDEAAKFVPIQMVYLLFLKKHVSEDAAILDKQSDFYNVVPIRKCCFLRGMEELYQRVTGRAVDYKPEWSHTVAAEQRCKVLGGDDALESFCWATDKYGIMSWNINSGYHPNFPVSSGELSAYYASIQKAEQVFPAPSPPNKVSRRFPVSSKKGSPVVRSPNEMQILRQKYKIHPTCEVQSDILKFLDEHDWIENEGHMVMDPQVLVVQRLATLHDNLGEVAIDWYSRNLESGKPVLTVSVEWQNHIATLGQERLRLLYKVSGCLGTIDVSDIICELCGDIKSHPTKYCVRYPSYEKRQTKLGKACSGCANLNCSLQNNAHMGCMLDGCEECKENQKTVLYYHKNWMCNSSSFWRVFNVLFTAMCCLDRATLTWSDNDLDLVMTCDANHPGIRKEGRAIGSRPFS